MGFARGYAEYLSQETGHLESEAIRVILIGQLRENISPSIRQQYEDVVSALTSEVDEVNEQSRSVLIEKPTLESRTTRPVSQNLSGIGEQEEFEITEDIYIRNAGLVLAAPYLPRLFDMLSLTEASAFKDFGSTERAVHLLQFMVNERTSSPEYELVLNKLLCGFRTGVPIMREISVTDSERETVEGLIRGMIQNWRVIGNTSVSGFRESFLQREGRLQLRNNTWHLLVEPKAFDMLLDQIPWSFSTIRHSWMERVIQVEWR